MYPENSAFEDALIAVATSNTATYLSNRLRPHPLVQYLVDCKSHKELVEKLSEELKRFDKTLEKTTIILLLVQAIINKSDGDTLPPKILSALDKSEVIWARELIQIASSKQQSTSTLAMSFNVSKPTTFDPKRISSSANTFLQQNN